MTTIAALEPLALDLSSTPPATNPSSTRQPRVVSLPPANATLTPDARPINILLLGAGTVGTAFARLVSRRVGAKIKQVLVRDPRRARDSIDPRALIGPEGAIDLRGVDVCVEALGGIEPALSLARRVLAAGIPFVTANKTLIAAHGEELAALANQNGTEVRFEAAVGAAIPCVRFLRDALKSSRIRRVFGILNGTSHFILSEWLRPGVGFEEALREAQSRGYAEANPLADLNGDDAAQKLAILNWQLTGRLLARDEVLRVELPTLRHETLTTLAACGYTVKPAACLSWRADGTPEAWVAPAAVPSDTLLAASSGNAAVVVVDTVEAGQLTLTGQGAGGTPTATALLDDVVDVLQRRPTTSIRPELEYGVGDGPKEWVIHAPVASGLRPGDLEKRLGLTGGWIGRQRWFPGGRCVLTINGLPWNQELTSWIVGRGGCVLEVLK